MHHVRAAMSSSFDSNLPTVPIRVDRLKLAKRLWRGAADDGADFGFDCESPLKHGDVVWVTTTARYVIEQTPEPVLEVSLEDASPDAAAVLGWAVGNMHFVIEAQPGFVRAPDDPALRQSLARLAIPFRETSAVFQPHRFASIVAHSHAPAPAHEHPYLRPAR
jgi:urease accessory protein